MKYAPVFSRAPINARASINGNVFLLYHIPTCSFKVLEVTQRLLTQLLPLLAHILWGDIHETA
jgi:hypothetical protein